MRNNMCGTSLSYRKGIAWFAVFAIFTCAICFFVIPNAVQASSLAKSAAEAGVNTNFANVAELVDMREDIVSILLGTETYGGEVSSYKSIFVSSDYFNEGFMAIGLALAMFWCYVGLIEDLQRGDASMELWLRFFVKFGVAMLLIVNSHTLTALFQKFGYSLTEYIQARIDETLISQIKTSTSSSSFVEAVLNNYLQKFGLDTDGTGFWNKVGNAVLNGIKEAFTKNPTEATAGGIASLFSVTSESAILSFAFFMIKITLKSATYVLYIELFIRRMFMPIALANVASDGMRSSGIRFLKKYLALYIKIGIMVVTVNMAYVMVAYRFEDESSFFFSVIAIYTAATGVALGAQQYADEIVGV